MATSDRHAPQAVPGVRSRGGLALLMLLLAGCAAPRPDEERGQQEGQEPTAGGEDAPLFDEDPFGDGGAVAGGEGVAPEREGRGGSVIVPFEPLGGMEEIEAPSLSEELVQRNSELNLAMLRARSVQTELGNTSRVVVDPGPHTFGDQVEVRIESRNPFGEPLELIAPEEGLILEVTWEIRRWLPIDGNDRVLRKRFFRLDRWFTLDADQGWWESTSLPLQVDGDPGALWTVKVGARLRCAGAQLGDQQLPVHEFDFQGGSVLVLPPGWEALRDDPLAALERLAGMPQAAADRHVLVATALLDGRRERRAGLDLLLDKLATLGEEGGIAPRRAVSFCTALQWLTGLEDMGNQPADWLVWKRRIERSGASAPGDDA